MKSTATQATHQVVAAPTSLGMASRRNWLKGLGALLGTGVLAATPTAVFASPSASVGELLSASDLVGGDEYIGMVKILAGPAVPQGWVRCDGQLLSVARHPALFAIIGAVYGGDGHATFALPKLVQDQSSTPSCAHPSPHQPVAPVGIFAIKIANAPATAGTVAELRMKHHCRPRAGRVA